MIRDNLLAKLYQIARLRKWSRSRLVGNIQNQMHSGVLRDVFRKYHKIDVGLYSYGGCFLQENIAPNTTIGRYCSFAPKVYIYGANHPLSHPSQHPFFYNPSLSVIKTEQIERSSRWIGNDVWIGQNAIVTSRVSRIGNGAVIGAGSVVTRDVEDFSIVAGNPAKHIRYRFPEPIRAQLLASKWWNLSIEEITLDKLDYFIKPLAESSVSDFLTFTPPPNQD